MDRKKKKVAGVPTRTRESVTDERFTRLFQNPVYRPVPKKEKKVEIDQRFQGMFNDTRFKLKYKVDKRGRPITTATDENMKRYYNVVDEEKTEKDSNSEEEESDSEIEGNMDEEKMAVKIPGQSKKIDETTRTKLRSSEIDYARGEADLAEKSSSSEEDDSDSSADEAEVEMLEHDWGELDKDADRVEDGTRRLALCNMDWDRVRAVDLMVLLSSFLPPGGVIKEVAIYPSAFGKERMADEDREGPKELKDESKIKKEENSSDEEESEEDQDEDEDGEGNQYHREKLRQYQLNRLRYYYAVAEFDSVTTAEKVYAECDGMEYESSAARVDLRFIPDDTSFEEDVPKEVCREVPDVQKYRPRFFTTTALQQVKVNLTWDETDPMRKELTEKIFDPKEKVDDDDIRAYLATSSEEEDDEDEEEGKELEEEMQDTKKKKKADAISMYKALLDGIDQQDKKKKDKDVEMEITWGVGLKENTEKLVKKRLEEDSKKNRTPWEERLDKRKEKRQQRKQEKKKSNKEGDEEGSTEDDGDKEDNEEQPFSDDEVDVDMEDEFFKTEMRENSIFKEAKKKKKKEISNGKGPDGEITEQKKKSSAELELLLMDDEDDGKRHFSLKKILEEENDSPAQKKKWKKKMKRKQAEGDTKGMAQDNFEIDVDDQRFSALFNSHHFNVDPSDPNFKKTKAMTKIIEEKQKRRADKLHAVGAKDEDDDTQEKKRKLEANDLPGKEVHISGSGKKAELSSLVKSVKRNTENLKMQQQQQQQKSNFSHKKGSKFKFK